MKRLLGIFDFVCVVLLVVGYLNNFIFLLPAFYLIVKGLIFVFSKDLASVLDILSGIYFVLLFFGLSYLVITILVGVYLLQKAILSLFR